MRASVPTLGPNTSNFPRHSGAGGTRLRDALAYVELVWRVHKERSQLKKLDPRMLKDLGLTQDMVERETNRHPMDLPTSRREDLWL